MTKRNHCTTGTAVLYALGCAFLTSTMLITPTQAAVEPGIVRIWGLCSAPSGMPAGVKDISAEANHSMILHNDGSISAWGGIDIGIGQVPEPNVGYQAIATTFLTCIAVKKDGKLVTWGRNDVNGSYPSLLVLPSPNTDFTAVAGGLYHGMALRKDGSVVCWGENNKGQCHVPDDNQGFVAIGCGDEYSIALRGDGRIAVWGDNAFGQLNVPVPNSGYIAISAGIQHIMAMRNDGTVVSWGANCWGQNNIPAGMNGCRKVIAGAGVSSAILQDGTVVSWGYTGSHLQDIPATTKDIVLVATGGDKGYTVHADGSLDIISGDPIEELYQPKYVAIAAGSGHFMALDTDGKIVGYGSNNSGELTIPAPNTGYKSIAANADFSYAVKSDGSIAAFGHSFLGCLDVPQPNTGFTAVSAGMFFGLGLKADGSVVGWGNNGTGGCDIPSPNSDFVEISAGGKMCMGIKAPNRSNISWGNGIVPRLGSTDTKGISAGNMMWCTLNKNNIMISGGQYMEGIFEDNYFDMARCLKISAYDIRGAVLLDGSIKIKGDMPYGVYDQYGQVSMAPLSGSYTDITVGSTSCMAIQRQFTISGNIKMPHIVGRRPNQVWIHLLKPGTETIVEHIFPICAADGSFSMPAYANGVYDIRVSAPHMLSVRMNNVDYRTTPINVDLKGGDLDDDGQVNLFDFVMIDRAFGSSDKDADVNSDGQVNLFDYVVVDANFGARGE